MLKRLLCCCCCCNSSSAPYGALSSSEGDGDEGEQQQHQQQQERRSPRTRKGTDPTSLSGKALSLVNGANPFEIEIDDAEESEEGETLIPSPTSAANGTAGAMSKNGGTHRSQSSSTAFLDADAALEDALEDASDSGIHAHDSSLRRNGSSSSSSTSPRDRKHREEIELQHTASTSHSHRSTSPSHSDLLRSPGSEGTVTRADLESSELEMDEDLVRFRKALEGQKRKSSSNKPNTTVAVSTTTAAATNVPVLPIPAVTLPIVNRKHKDSVLHSHSQSMPTTPFETIGVNAPIKHVKIPPPSASAANSVASTPAADLLHTHPPQSHPPMVHSLTSPAIAPPVDVTNSFSAAVQAQQQQLHALPVAQPVAATAATASSSSSSSTAAPSKSAAATSAAASLPATGNPLDRLHLPGGVLSVAHMESLMSVLKSTNLDSLQQGVSYGHLFEFLYALSRSITGKVIRPFLVPELKTIIAEHEKAAQHKSTSGALKRSSSMQEPMNGHQKTAKASSLALEPAKLLLSFLQWLHSIEMDTVNHTIRFKFDFPGNVAYQYIDAPSQDTWVLSSGFTKDPFKLHPSNKPKIYRNESHRLCIHKELLMKFTAKGIESLRSGDVSIKKFVSFNADMRTEFRPGMVEYDNAKNAFIQMEHDDESKPLIIDGYYQPRTFDYWLVVTVLNMDNWVGLPVIGPQHPPNVHMKPHPNKPYP